MTEKNSGKLIYTDRAYRQDAELAMRNDITYGLIELLTNADDEYKAIDSAGSIEIFVRTSDLPTGFVAEVGVRDSAGGLTRAEMLEAFTDIGRRNKMRASGKDTQFGTRGLFGRGAKDVATFGKGVFTSYKKQKISVLELDGASPRWEFLRSEETASSALLGQYGFQENQFGLLASMFIKTQKESALPAPKRLVEKLSTHIALRDIISHRPVFLSDDRTKGKTQLRVADAGKEEILSIDLDLNGFEAPARLSLYRLARPENGAVDEFSPHGIVVSDSRASYENTFFSLKGRPEVGWIHGRVDAPEIATLATEFDEFDEQQQKGEISTETTLKNNPNQIIKRDRSGLEKKHPYYRALAAAVSSELKPILDQIAGEGETSESESKALTKRLSSLGRTLGQLVQTALDEADLEDSLEGGRKPEEIDFLIVPPVQKVGIGETATFQVWVNKDLFDSELLTVDLIDGFGVAEFTEPSTGEARAHKRLPISVVDIRVKGTSYGSAEIVVRHGDFAETARIVCEPLSEYEPEIPLTFKWQKERYRMAPGRSRNLVLLAPPAFAGQHAAIAVEDPLVDIDSEVVEFKWAKSMTHLVGSVKVAGGTVVGRTSITASIENESTQTTIEVKEVEESSGPEIRFRFDSTNPNPPTRSALVPDEGLLTVWIFANHSIIKPLLGKYVGDGFEGDDSPAFKSALSEIVATEMAGYVLQREQEIHPSRNRDAASLLAAQQRLVLRFLKALHLGLLEALRD